MFTKKTILPIVLLITAFCLPACKQTTTATPTAVETKKATFTPAPVVIETTLGDFVIASTRFVKEVNGVKPGRDEKILLVILTRPNQEKMDRTTIPLEKFSQMTHDTTNGEIYILSDDGTKTIHTMGGWVDKELALGFRLPVTAKSYTLYWQHYPPIEIVPEEADSSN